MNSQFSTVWLDIKKTASFVTVSLTRHFFAYENFHFNEDVSEETDEMCWQLNVCLLYSLCAFYMEVN